MTRFILALAFMICCTVTGKAQHMNWLRLAEDTVYYAKEYLPDRLWVTPSGPAQSWDFRSLKAPYAISQRVVTTGVRQGKSYANLVNGHQADGVLVLDDKIAQQVQAIAENPLCRGSRLTYTFTPAYKPFFHGAMGETYTYRGRMIAAFAWPRGMTCSWMPAHPPDSCRITYTIMEDVVVDGEGMLYLPTETSRAYRQKAELRRAILVEAKYGRHWKNVTGEVPGIRLSTTTEHLRFVSAETGLLLAEIEVRDGFYPVSVVFKTHPVVTRIVTEEPDRPDIFAYPNPSYDMVRFQLGDILPGRYKIILFNILGVQVRAWDIDISRNRETFAYDLSDLPRGTYLYRLQDRNGRAVKTKRVTLIRS